MLTEYIEATSTVQPYIDDLASYLVSLTHSYLIYITILLLEHPKSILATLELSDKLLTRSRRCETRNFFSSWPKRVL